MFDRFTKKTGLVLLKFLDNPEREFYLREISKALTISPSTAKNALDTLGKGNIITKVQRANASFYRLNIDSKEAIELKKARNMELILRSGAIEQLEKQNQTIISMILFGSFAKGTNTAKSDIDILIISNKKTDYSLIEIEGFEVNIIQFTPSEWRKKAEQDRPFYMEMITTGKVLKGMLPEV